MRPNILKTAWGITRGKIAYDPPAQTPGELKLVRQEQPDGAGLVRCFLQAEPARQIPHLRGIPILILVSESSYHAPYDHCTARFLDQAGVKNSFVKLADHGCVLESQLDYDLAQKCRLFVVAVD